MKQAQFKLGDRVQLSPKFLKSIQADLETAEMVGTVVKINEYPRINKTVLKIKWDNQDEISGALSLNICKIIYKEF